MSNLIEFLRMFLSYGLVLLICVAIMGTAIFIGITVRKAKNSKENAENVNECEAKN